MRTAPALACVVFALSGSVLAQEPIRESQRAEELRADWVIGSTVTTPAGETIGTIVDLLLDEEEGGVTGAVVSVGGFLGFGAKEVAVKWQDLEQTYDGAEIVLDMTREEAEDAPAFGFRPRETAPPPEPDTGVQGGGMQDGGTATPPPE